MKQSHIIVGTAGHVDHGKTHLTIALTGIDTDRLPEEKRRGLTIVPGFVPLDLKSGRRLGLIDVPGHEQFVKNMLAGVAGIDMVLFVIAADEGVMPQTVEHLNILNLLGINKGVVAITKSDMVDEEWLTMITEDVKQLLAPTALKNAPIIAVSAQKGYHIEELKDLLDEVASTVKERPFTGLARIPVDRVFHKQGFGTVITGTLWSGHIDNGQTLELLPAGVELRVRGIRVHDVPVEEAQAGQRTALNLTGPEVEAIKPGCWLAQTGVLQESHRLDVALDLLKGAKSLSKHAPVRVFHGTAEVLGRVRLLDRDLLLGGESCLCQIELEGPLAPLRGDRVILRGYSPIVTIAGATVLDANPPRYKLSDPNTMKTIERKSHLDAGQGILTALLEKNSLLNLQEVTTAAQLTKEETLTALQDLQARGQVQLLAIDGNTLYYTGEQDANWQQLLTEALQSCHGKYPLRRGIPIPEIRQRLLTKLNVKQCNALLNIYEQQGLLTISSEGVVAKADFVPKLTPTQKDILAKAELAYTEGAFMPPDWEELSTQLKIKPAEAQEYLGWLLDNKKVSKIATMLFMYDALNKAQQLLKAQHPQTFTIAEARDVWKTSRKFAQLLLDTMDSQGITKREGDSRVFLK